MCQVLKLLNNNQHEKKPTHLNQKGVLEGRNSTITESENARARERDALVSKTNVEI